MSESHEHYAKGTAGRKIIDYLVKYYGQDYAAMQALNGWDLVQLREKFDRDALNTQGR